MKKNFFKKKLASALALALVVASFSPAGISAQAATATKIVKQGGGAAPAVLYVGGSKVDYSLSTIKSGVKYTWKSSNTKIATITATTGVVTAKAPGSVTITATATNKKTGKVLNTFKKTLTVNLRSTAVEAGDDFTLATGETKKLAATLTPSNSTDVINYVSSNKAVATVGLTGGVVTGKEAGEATITVYAKATKSTSNKSTKNKVDTIKVTVPVGITEVKQTSDVALNLTFNAEVKDIKASDLALKNSATNAVQAIKSVKVSDDGKVVTVTTYVPFTDKAEYTLTYDKKDYKLAASVGAVSSIVIKTTQVAFGTDSAIEYSLFDANGIELTNYDSSKITVDVDTTGGYKTGTTTSPKINLFAKGNTAAVTVTYHTWTYENNVEKTVVAKGTIVAVDPTEITIGGYEKYTISGASVDWSKDAVTTIAVGDTGKNIYLRVKDSTKNYVTTGIKFESADSTVLLVGENGALTPVKEGGTYVIATVGKTKFTLPVTVVAKRDAASVALDKYSVSLSNTSLVNDSIVVTATAKDQYSADLGSTVITAADLKSGQSSNLPHITGINTNKLTVSGQTVGGTSAAAGTYNYVLTVNGKQIGFNVTILDAKEATPTALTTQLLVSTNSVDTKIGSTTTVADKAVDIKLARYNFGVLYDYVTGNVGTSVSVTTPGAIVATPVSVTGGVATYDTVHLTAGHFTKEATGTYKITVAVTGGATYTAYFVVSDTQALPKANLDKLTTSLTYNAASPATGIAIAQDVLTIKDADGNTLADSVIVGADISYVADGKSVTITKVTVRNTIGANTVDTVINVGAAVTTGVN